MAAAALILVTITAVAAFRIAGLSPAAQVPASDQPLEVRELRFEDSPEGEVLVYASEDDAGDRLVHVVEPGQGGFIRGVLRSMARSRRASGIGSEHPFVLIAEPNGTLLLEDPQTGERIYLPAFGPTNIDTFRAMLPSDDPRQ